jgi:hypothetical protein
MNALAMSVNSQAPFARGYDHQRNTYFGTPETSHVAPMIAA